MDLIAGGYVVGKALANEGIEHGFTLVGGHVLPGHGEMVSKPEEIIPAIKRAVANGGGPCVHDVADPELQGEW